MIPFSQQLNLSETWVSLLTTTWNLMHIYRWLFVKQWSGQDFYWNVFFCRNKDLLLKAYITYVRLILEYCSPVWSPHHKYLIKLSPFRTFRVLCCVIKFYMVVVILQLLVVLYTGLMILREVISLNCTNVIALLMSPNTILPTELSIYGTIFQTLLSRFLACYHFVISWLNLIWVVFVLIFNFWFFSIYMPTLLCYHCLLCSLFCPCILSVLVAFGSFRYQ